MVQSRSLVELDVGEEHSMQKYEQHLHMHLE